MKCVVLSNKMVFRLLSLAIILNNSYVIVYEFYI